MCRLYRLIAAATGLEVVAGPVEASAIGNLLVQVRAGGLIRDRGEMRSVVSRSFELKRLSPDPDLRQLAAAARKRLAAMVAAREIDGVAFPSATNGEH
jgi:rhamnulokinase